MSKDNGSRSAYAEARPSDSTEKGMPAPLAKTATTMMVANKASGGVLKCSDKSSMTNLASCKIGSGTGWDLGSVLSMVAILSVDIC